MTDGATSPVFFAFYKFNNKGDEQYMTTLRDVTKIVPIVEKYYVLPGLAVDKVGPKYLPTAVTKFRTGIKKLKKLRLSTSGKQDVALLIKAFELAAESAEKGMNGQDDKSTRREMVRSFQEFQRRCEKAIGRE